MRQLPEAMYEIHGALKDYIAVHNAVFKKGLFSIFKPIPFGEHWATLGDVWDRLSSAEESLRAEEDLPQVFLDYVTALRNTVEQLKLICSNLHRETIEVGSYKYRTYNQDVAVYHAMEKHYVALGQRVNQLISSPR